LQNNYSIFDIIGPILIGPSSSHTAGACRLANAAKAIFNKPISHVVIYVYGSFSQTLYGHGTSKALVGGLLGIAPDDERLYDAFKLAQNQKLTYQFLLDDSTISADNIVRFEITGQNGEQMSVTGSSIGGGSIIISKIDEMDLQISLKFDSIVVEHLDKPGAILHVSTLLAQSRINIASMNVYRKAKYERAYMIIEIDQPLDADTLAQLRRIEDTKVIYLSRQY
jgi:L-serine dehydratase